MPEHEQAHEHTATQPDAAAVPTFDALIIGAGISGMYQLHRLRALGMQVRVFEAGTDVGGTWYWNRYPGARFDSESYSYGYSFSPELLQAWDWSEHFSPQPETLRYLNHVADRFDLRRDIRFGAFVTSAHWDDAKGHWTITLEGGEQARGRFLITAIGAFTKPTLPAIPGIEDFAGECHHTARWPHEPVDFSGKRVAVIGTGATGVQVIQEVAKTAAQLTVYQRTANWCVPLHNRRIEADEQARIKASYPEIFARCRQTHGAFLHGADPRYAMQLSAEEREAFWEALYAKPGFGLWLGNFRDVLVDPAANALLSEWVARKIRARVNDPATAEKLIPHNHGFGTRRIPMETNYYEVYNQPNVTLVDVRATPIQRIVPEGVKAGDGTRAFDMIVFATGFDAVLGGFEQIDVRGRDGLTLRQKWRDGPRTMLGLQTTGFPNMLTLVGPHNSATFCNIPRCIEQNVEWVTDLLQYMRAHGHMRIEPTPEAEAEWTQHVQDTAAPMLFNQVDSWFMGINSNVEGRDHRTFLLYAGGAPRYRERCDEIARAGYRGFVFSDG